MTKSLSVFAFALLAPLGSFATCPAHAEIASPNNDIVIKKTITVQCDVVSSAAAGDYQVGAKTFRSTAKQVADEKERAAAFDGPTQFKVAYSISLKSDGTVGYEKSWVKLATVYYTLHGSAQVSSFATPSLPVTSVGLNADRSVNTITFKTLNWYPPAENNVGELINNGVYSSIVFDNGKLTFISLYKIINNGVIDTYTLTCGLPKVVDLASDSSVGIGISGLAGLGLFAAGVVSASQGSHPKPLSP